MRLLLDANISVRIVAPLTQMGHDVISQHTEDPNADDEVILQHAFRDKRVVVTYDKDFGELVFKHGAGYYGVILLRTRDESYRTQLQVLGEFLNTHAEHEVQEHFWVITEFSAREAQS